MFPSDDDDKTVFRGGAADDRTVLRPTPGGRTSVGAVQPQQPMPGGVAPAAVQQPPQAVHEPAMPTRFTVSQGLNPLVNAASTLLAVIVKLRNTVSHPDPNGLYQRLGHEIKSFEAHAKEQGARPEVILAARYAVCSAIDEAVLSTPWGSESPWMQRTLLSAFHNETSGGEKFFLIVERMRENPVENNDILELLYLILSLGFEGRYRLMDRGRDKLEEIRDELFRIVRRYRGEYERDLSPHWRSEARGRSKLAEYVPMWVIAAVAGALLLVSYLGFRVWLYNSSAPIVDELLEIAEVGEPAAKERVPLIEGRRGE